MKAKFYFLTLFTAMFLNSFSQQIPNGSFENWNNKYTPTGWSGVEDLLSTLLPITTSYFTFKDTTTFTQGTASIKLLTDTVPGVYNSIVGIQPGLATLGTAALVPSGGSYAPAFTGIPFAYRPDSIIFDYFATSPGLDSGGVQLALTRRGAVVLGAGTYLHLDSNWVHVALPLAQAYVSTDYPDTLTIQFVSSAHQTAVVGTSLHVDGVRFGYVNQPLSVVTSGTGVLCTGDSITLQANAGGSPNYSYQWGLAGTPISGAVSATYVAKATGSYTVTIDSSGSTVTSQPVVIATDSIVATIIGLNDTLCTNSAAVVLHGTPAGGVYSGNGVTSSTFRPSPTLLGLDTVTYQVTDINGCAKSGIATVLLKDCTGIEEIEGTTLSVYPNPATSLLNVNSNQNLAGFTLGVYDLLGRAVISQILTGNSNVVHVAGLANGTYIYRVTDKENGVITQSKFDIIK